MSLGAQQTGNQTSTNAPLPYLYPDIGQAQSSAAALYGAGGPSYYPGQTVAGFSNPQQTAMQRIFNLGTNRNVFKPVESFDRMLLNGGGSNPWLDKTYQQAATASQNQLASEYANAGRNVDASMPMRSQQLNQLATDIYGGNYQNTLNAAQNAGNQLQDVYGTRMGGLNSALGIGGMVQNQAQNLINADKQKFDYYQNLPGQNLSQFEQYLGPLMNGGQTSSPIYQNPLANALGLGESAAGIYALLASDRRLKTDIRKVGTTEGGLPIYTFRYKGSPTTVMGVMADEVRGVRPDAVVTHPSGFDMVDYSKVQ